MKHTSGHNKIKLYNFNIISTYVTHINMRNIDIFKISVASLKLRILHTENSYN